MVNRAEAERIAGAVNALRPDWAPASVVAVIADDRIRHRAYPDLTHAFVALALDHTSRKPTRIFEAGPWWTAPGVVVAGPSYRYPAHDDCDTCGLPRITCERQNSLVSSDDQHQYRPRGTTT